MFTILDAATKTRTVRACRAATWFAVTVAMGGWAVSPTFAQFLESDVEVLYQIDGEAVGDQFGFVLDPIGDLDGDGAPEILTSAVYHDAGGFQSGKVYLISGASGTILRTHIGHVVWGMFGWRIASAGDINGDGIEDYTVGAAGEQGSTQDGQVFVFSGDLNLTAEESLLWQIDSFASGDRFGHATGRLPDINGDGHDELLVGAPKHDAAGNDAGRVYIFSGADQSILRIQDGDEIGGRFGNAARSIGDVNDDGFHDYVVTSPGAGPTAGGKAAVYSGVDGAFLYGMTPSSASAVDYGRYFANSPGDMTGDGVPDLFISDFWDNAAGPRTGIAYLYDGSDGTELYSIAGNDAQDWTGFGGRTVGDIDQDGFAEFLTNFTYNPEVAEAPFGGRVVIFSGVDGSPLRTITSLFGNPEGTQGEWFGYDCTGIDDVNGDGIPDLVATAGYNYANGPQTGRLYVIAGKVYDPASTPEGSADPTGSLELLDFSPSPMQLEPGGVPSSPIRLRLEQAREVELAVFDAGGRVVGRRSRMQLAAGEQAVSWQRVLGSETTLLPGVYFVRAASADRDQVRKVVLVRP